MCAAYENYHTDDLKKCLDEFNCGHWRLGYEIDQGLKATISKQVTRFVIKKNEKTGREYVLNVTSLEEFRDNYTRTQNTQLLARLLGADKGENGAGTVVVI